MERLPPHIIYVLLLWIIPEPVWNLSEEKLTSETVGTIKLKYIEKSKDIYWHSKCEFLVFEFT